MYRKLTLIIIISLTLFFPARGIAQQSGPRLQQIQATLDSLAQFVPGLNKKVQLSISGVPAPDYLRAIGRANNISFHIDPSVNFTVNNIFIDVTASNILLLLAQQYNLDISATGVILVVKAHPEPVIAFKPATKQINIRYRDLDNALSMDLSNDSLTAVAKKITTLSGKNIIVPPGLQGKMVTAFISGAGFDVAMDKLAFSNELKMVKTNDSFYLFQPLDDNEQLYVNGDRKTDVKRIFKPINNAPAGNLGLSVQTVGGQKLISVSSANAGIAELVRSASQEMGKSYFVYSEIKGTINTINANDLTYENFLNLVFKGTDYTFNQADGVYLIGDRKLEGLRSHKVVMLQNRSIDTVLALVPAEWKRGVEVKEFREQNTLILSGSKPQIEEIASLIKQIDVLVPQILIEVTLIDVHKTRRVSTGISAGTADSIKTGGTLLPGLDYTFGSKSVNEFLNKVGGIFSTNLGHVTPNFYLNVSALESKNNIEVRSVPKLATLNGHTASLSIGNSVFYKNVTQNLYPSAATNTSVFTNEYKESDANLTINIRPLVSGDDQVTLGIKIDISDFTSLPTDGSPPPKSTSKFESVIRVHNEDMIVLGGIERTEDADSSSGVPLLSRIPLLKYLFSSRTKTKAKVVTLVFIKPTIIR
ncbi:type II secretion system protein GspD [Mucilaginibacter psychrotolerans]|uniref:type II secretion system protein GspD n=1 Tax=Mucilaginibacter psychrotolerans TaxID=1524096 RepID=UPI001EFF7315|nr:general secretion pathway protein GspD [Mucilaginibacter psychrotolerans]